MIRDAATLEAGVPQQGGLPNDFSPPAAPRGAVMKFLYASGSRPLDGYTIKRGIGRGGFGEVYFATSDAGKEVALKHVERNLDVELRGVGHCLNLKHVNLIDLYDVRYDEQGEAWVVMEYVSGESLKDVIDRNPNGLPLEEVDQWFRGVAAGVQYLHDHGIVHRDLKPGNIFEDDGVVKIGDYGLSKFISCSRRSGQTESVGTFHYMAPEIGKGVYGKEIDIYALGIVLYEMITGRVPFEGESSQEIIMKHLTADPDVSVVPTGYRALVQRAMQKDPEKRFHDVAEMVALLPSPEVAMSAAVAATPVASVANAATRAVRRNGHGDAEPFFIGDDEREILMGPVRPVLNPRSIKKGAPPPRVVLARNAKNEEPIAKAFKEYWSKLSAWWTTGAMATPIKILLLVAVAVLGVFHAAWLVPLALTLVAVYVVYLGIRMLAETLNASPTAATAAPMPQYRSEGWRTLSAEQQGRAALRMRTFGDRAAELSGSMLAATVISAVLSVVMLVLYTAMAEGARSGVLDGSMGTIGSAVWLWLVTVLGSWSVLVAGKFMESSSGEQIRRRFAMLVVGMMLALVAFGLSQFLMVDMVSISAGEAARIARWQRGMIEPSGVPLLPAYLAFFGAVFATVGWWKQTDPLRSSRFAVGRLVTTGVIGLIWMQIWPFPGPWAYFLPVAMAVAVQLSSPWLNKQERTALRQRLQEAR